MPISQMRNGLTAGNSIFSQKPTVKVSKSRFNLGRMNYFTADFGMIIPVDVIPTLPGDSFDLSCQYQIDFRPLLVPSLSSYKVKVHYYYCPNQYLWEGWESFISKGRSGSLALTVPKIKLSQIDKSVKFDTLTDPLFSNTGSGYYPLGVSSLAGYMCGAIPYHSVVAEGKTLSHYKPFIDGDASLVDTGIKKPDVNALPFLMYQKIFRSNYIDPNLYSNGVVKSPVWFPDDIDSSHWRFNYALTNVDSQYGNYFVPIGETLPSSKVANFVPIPDRVASHDENSDNVVDLLQLRYSSYSDDMFTTALPFLQRGPQTLLDLDLIYSSDAFMPLVAEQEKSSALSLHSSLPASGISGNNQLTSSFSPSSGISYYLEKNFNIPTSGTKSFGFGVNPSSSGASVSFSAQQLRSLLALSVWQERNALTNGSYGQFIKVHFDNSPNNSYCEPIYIGGTTSLFNVNSVLQTSASVNGSTPQGNPVGVGGSSGNGSLGTFRASDFGFIMALMTIQPDTVYTQMNEHWVFETSPDDYFMPEYEQLSYQPILNKQLYCSGSSSTDDDIFGYSNRYVYLKQRDSVARGNFALPSNVDAYYNSYVQTRTFSSTPSLTQQFVTVYPPNVDRSILAYPSEPAFIVQFYSGVNAVRPLSYLSRPNDFGF